jgi:hypothetical protein
MSNNLTQQTIKIKYTMCGRPGSCCPVITETEDNKFTITDDYDGKVTLTKDELSLLKKFLILIDRVFLRSSLSKLNSRLVKNKLEKNLNYRITVRYNKSDKNLFTELCDFYGSDKGSQGSNLAYPWPAHTYSDFYSTIFSNFRSSVKKVYENGIGTNNTNLTSNMSSTGIPGASLRVWRDYFPNSIVIGTDIDRDVLFL